MTLLNPIELQIMAFQFPEILMENIRLSQEQHCVTSLNAQDRKASTIQIENYLYNLGESTAKGILMTLTKMSKMMPVRMSMNASLVEILESGRTLSLFQKFLKTIAL